MQGLHNLTVLTLETESLLINEGGSLREILVTRYSIRKEKKMHLFNRGSKNIQRDSKVFMQKYIWSVCKMNASKVEVAAVVVCLLLLKLGFTVDAQIRYKLIKMVS